MSKNTTRLFLIAFFSVLPAVASAEEAPDNVPWEMIAMAHTVFVGAVHISTVPLSEAGKIHLLFAADVDEYLKGNGGKHMGSAIDLTVPENEPTIHYFLTESGQKRVVLLFEKAVPVLWTFSPEFLEKVRRETESQENYLSSFKKTWTRHNTPYYRDVKKLISFLHHVEALRGKRRIAGDVESKGS